MDDENGLAGMLPNYALGALDALNATVGSGAEAKVVEEKVVAVEAEVVAAAVFLVSSHMHHSQQDVHRMTCIP